MASPLPEDPYIALGLAKDATPAAIKASYRKLVLKFHPDKVTDESQKQAAADQFHKIQTAYETIGDEDKKARYDAQCKLAELRKDVLSRQGSAGPKVEVRTAAYKMPTEAPGRAAFTAKGPDRFERVHVEERRPYEADYFDRPRSSTRKDYEYERTKRPAPQESRERPRVTRQDTKENERVRQREKVRQTTRDTTRERDSKYATVEEDTESDSDPVYEREKRRRAEEEQQRRAKEAYYEQARRQKDDTAGSYFSDDRTKKMFATETGARDYIERSRGANKYQEPERPPSSPSRISSKDKVEYIKRGEGRPTVMVRRGSGKPQPREREAESPRRDRQGSRRYSDEYEELPRRPPTLSTTKSAPSNIKLPEEKHRSYSMQAEFERRDEFQPPPMRRADSMPQQMTGRGVDPRKPLKTSSLRQTEINEGIPTPGVSPDPSVPSPTKYHYGQEYADDFEYPTPNGYRTEVRNPVPAGGRRVTRSPSPIRENPRAREARYATQSPRVQAPMPSRTTSYVYTPGGVEQMKRPSMSRHESTRKASQLYGEIPTTNSPRPRKTSPDDVKYREIKPEDVRYQTGYSTNNGSRRASEVRPGYSRTNSFNTQPVYAS